MAGIYIHIPYCKQACHYCDFHFSTNQKTMAEMIQAIQMELSMRADYLDNEELDTLYFGGGTPSILDKELLNAILEEIQRNYPLKKELEVTLEANPDDLSKTKCEELKSLGITRLSIGIQSFDDKALTQMNRAHTSHEAIESVQRAREAGFENISIDLIFGSPPADGSMIRLKSDLQRILDLHPEHISVYGLTIEAKTAFGKWFSNGDLQVPDEDDLAAQYEYLIDVLTGEGYDHYEVSNFSLTGFGSKHNTSYWRNESYLGIGPGAHSYNGVQRSFNVKNNALYIKALKESRLAQTTESLSEEQRLNEYLLTSIRTKWGLDIDFLLNEWTYDLVGKHGSYLEKLISSGRARQENGHFFLTSKGFQIADDVTLRLFA